MKNPVVIGVAGGTGSGKTTVVEAIVEKLGGRGVPVIEHDSYYKDLSGESEAVTDSHNYDHPDALETGLLVEHLLALREGKKVEVPVYNYTTHSRSKEDRIVSPAATIIVEGLLLYAEKKLRDLIDIKIFVDTDDDIRFIRRLKRDMEKRGRTMENVIDQYLDTVRSMHIEFVEPSRKYADIIIPEGRNSVTVDLVVSMIDGIFKDASIDISEEK